MKAIVYGFGQMGQKIVNKLKEAGHEVACVVSPVFDHEIEEPMLHTLKDFNGEADILVDFSHPDNLEDILAYSKAHPSVRLVMATTGYSAEQIASIEACAQYTAVFQSYNTSFGISMLMRILKGVVKDFYDAGFDIEILEKHHHRKIDAPSGTAKLLYEVMEEQEPSLHPVYDRSSLHQKREHEEVGIQAMRGGTIFGEHEIMFAGLDEIVEIRHTALSRDVFVTGAIEACKALMEKEPGLYHLNNLY